MNYCKKCVLPDTRPGIVIDSNGVCNACKNSIRKETEINWSKRELQLQQVFKDAKKRSRGYDCLVPVSGGKDSTWQVVKCLEYGMNPLAVTWRTPGRTKIGQQNLDNLINLGVDHIDYQVNPKTEKKFMLLALEKFGATAIPMHMALFNIPLKIALRFDIPLVVWGENSAFEYGSEDEKLTGFSLNSSWLKKFGVTNGTTADDWVSDELTRKELTPYFGPSDRELEIAGIKAIFLGYYLKWDVENSLEVAMANGFKARTAGPKMGLYNYTDIDDDFMSIHHYLKWHKFGISRLWDNLSLEIRNNRISREDAIKKINEFGDQTPVEDIKLFCEFTKIDETRFYEIVEKFRNQDIWKKDEKNNWVIPKFLIKNWNWL
jgi:N-acetyl sugar amidotransferase